MAPFESNFVVRCPLCGEYMRSARGALYCLNKDECGYVKPIPGAADDWPGSEPNSGLGPEPPAFVPPSGWYACPNVEVRKPGEKSPKDERGK
jgi:hypothetical protein